VPSMSQRMGELFREGARESSGEWGSCCGRRRLERRKISRVVASGAEVVVEFHETERVRDGEGVRCGECAPAESKCSFHWFSSSKHFPSRRLHLGEAREENLACVCRTITDELT